MNALIGAFACIFAGFTWLSAILFAVQKMRDAYRWRAWCQIVGGEEVALWIQRDRVARDAETDRKIAAAFRRAFPPRPSAQVLPFPRIVNRGRPVTFSPDGDAA